MGGRPSAFQKYENADRLPSRAISGALILLVHDLATLDVLRAHRPAPQAGTHRATLRA